MKSQSWTSDIGKTIEIKQGKVKVDGIDRIVQDWGGTQPTDCKGKIQSIDTSLKGKVRLDNGFEFENPIVNDFVGKFSDGFHTRGAVLRDQLGKDLDCFGKKGSNPIEWSNKCGASDGGWQQVCPFSCRANS